MVPKWRLSLLVGLAFVLAMTACTSKEDSAQTTTTAPAPTTAASDPTTSTTLPVEKSKLVVWVDEDRAPVVEAAAQGFEEASDTIVEVEVMSFFEIRGAVVSAAPAGEGPDLFMDSNEGTGELAEAGVVAPLDLAGREAGLYRVALDAFTFEGDVFAMPFVIEAVGLFYNKDLVREPPADFDALRTTCDDLGYPKEDGVPCLAIPAGEPLHQLPFLTGFGGYLFGFENGAYDLTDVGLDSPGAIAGGTFLQGLYQDGYADDLVDYSAMADLFNQGAVPFMWTGPWQTGAVDAAGVNYGVAKLPLMDGNPPRPLVGSQGFFLSGLADSPETAMSFLLDHLATPEMMIQLSEATGRPSALRSAVDEVPGDPHLLAFLESGIAGLPFPNLPELEAAWGPLTDAFLAIDQGSADPASALRTAAELVRSATE